MTTAGRAATRSRRPRSAASSARACTTPRSPTSSRSRACRRARSTRTSRARANWPATSSAEYLFPRLHELEHSRGGAHARAMLLETMLQGLHRRRTAHPHRRAVLGRGGDGRRPARRDDAHGGATARDDRARAAPLGPDTGGIDDRMPRPRRSRRSARVRSSRSRRGTSRTPRCSDPRDPREYVDSIVAALT